MTLRKVIKTRASFPSEEAAMKLLFLALRNAAKKWKFVQAWAIALNHFNLLWGDRIEAARQRDGRSPGLAVYTKFKTRSDEVRYR